MRKCIVGVVVCAFLVVAAVFWIAGGILVAPASRTVGEPPAAWQSESLTIASESGSDLAAWYFPVQESPATVVLLHPVRGDRRSMLSRASLLRENGYSTLMIDLQSHGESPGDAITFGYLERLDAQAAVSWVRRNTPQKRIGVVGRSLGGAAAVLGSPLDIDCLVLESVYPAIEKAVDNRVRMRLGRLSSLVSPFLLVQLKPRLGITTADLRPLDHIADVDCPVLVVCGDHDEHTTLEESQSLYETAKETKQLLVFPGAKHEDLLAYDPERYRNEVIPFLNKWIGTVE